MKHKEIAVACSDGTWIVAQLHETKFVQESKFPETSLVNKFLTGFGFAASQRSLAALSFAAYSTSEETYMFAICADFKLRVYTTSLKKDIYEHDLNIGGTFASSMHKCNIITTHIVLPQSVKLVAHQNGLYCVVAISDISNNATTLHKFWLFQIPVPHLGKPSFEYDCCHFFNIAT